jgi:hypothetical protein
LAVAASFLPNYIFSAIVLKTGAHSQCFTLFVDNSSSIATAKLLTLQP